VGETTKELQTHDNPNLNQPKTNKGRPLYMPKPVYLLVGPPEDDYLPYGILSTLEKANSIKDAIPNSSVISMTPDDLTKNGITFFCQYKKATQEWLIEPTPIQPKLLNTISPYGLNQEWESYTIITKAPNPETAQQQANNILLNYQQQQQS
jgi:hypothetical protein